MSTQTLKCTLQFYDLWGTQLNSVRLALLLLHVWSPTHSDSLIPHTHTHHQPKGWVSKSIEPHTGPKPPGVKRKSYVKAHFSKDTRLPPKFRADTGRGKCDLQCIPPTPKSHPATHLEQNRVLSGNHPYQSLLTEPELAEERQKPSWVTCR